jgi:hypothetical protein
MTRFSCRAFQSSAVVETGRGGYGREPVLISTILISIGFLGGTLANDKRWCAPFSASGFVTILLKIENKKNLFT